ncbi:MAG: PRC-barrel domain-containing protein [Phycisphaerae bacterium]|jgi:hypothetical protein
MLRSLAGYDGYRIGATDTELGNVRDFYFDDRDWVVRYLIVDTKTWLPGRKVLVSPTAAGRSDAHAGILHVRLSAKQVENSPAIDADKPVSREMESRLAEHFGWSRYWRRSVPVGQAADLERSLADDNSDGAGVHLRSADEVTGYLLEADDGPVGRIEDLIIEDQNWGVRYLAVLAPQTSLAGRKVLIPRERVTEVSWAESKVHVDVPREAVKNIPEYDPSAPVNREYEMQLYDYHGRPKRRCDWCVCEVGRMPVTLEFGVEAHR